MITEISNALLKQGLKLKFLYLNVQGILEKLHVKFVFICDFRSQIDFQHTFRMDQYLISSQHSNKALVEDAGSKVYSK